MHWSTALNLVDLVAANAHARAHGLPVLVLGGGSNLVCSEEPFPGTVVEVGLLGTYASKTEPPKAAGEPWVPSLTQANVDLTRTKPPPALDAADTGDVWLHVAAGQPWDALVAATCRWGWAGIECLSGIPGKVGATPIQNVGAYGQELADSLWSVTCLDRLTDRLIAFSRDECELGYRHSRFKDQDRDRYVVVEVVLRLICGGQPTLKYRDLADRLGPSMPVSLCQVRQTVLETRGSKSMLLDASDPNRRNCGSFFVNPVVTREVLATLGRRVPTRVPAFDVDANRVKIPAAWLIEQAGFQRGQRQGAVGLSTNHTLCVVAHDGATTTHLLHFARHVRDTVQGKFGIELRPEPVLVGVDW